MKKTALMLALVVGVVGMTGRAWAADTDTISVTVSLETLISVSVTPDSWPIGPIGLGGTNALASTTAANDGNVAETFDIMGSDGAGGWVIGTPADADQFEVAVTAGPKLSTSYQQLVATVAAGADFVFDLTYTAPDPDTYGGGVDQSFTITIKASAAP